MIASVDKIMPGRECTEAIMMQQRTPWLVPGLTVLALVCFGLGVTYFPDGPNVITAVGFGLILGAYFGLAIKYWILARTADGQVHLLKSSKLSIKAVRLDHSFTAPLEMISSKQDLLTKTVFLKDEKYLVARPFWGRLKAVVD